MANILGFLWMGDTATRTRPRTHTVTNTRTATHIHTHPQPHTQLTPPAVCCLSDVMSLYHTCTNRHQQAPDIICRGTVNPATGQLAWPSQRQSLCAAAVAQSSLLEPAATDALASAFPVYTVTLELGIPASLGHCDGPDYLGFVHGRPSTRCQVGHGPRTQCDDRAQVGYCRAAPH